MENLYRKGFIIVSFADNVCRNRAQKTLAKEYHLLVLRWLSEGMAVVAVPEGQELRWAEALKKDVIVKAATVDEHL